MFIKLLINIEEGINVLILVEVDIVFCYSVIRKKVKKVFMNLYFLIEIEGFFKFYSIFIMIFEWVI